MTATRAAARKGKAKGDRLHRRSVVALQDADVPFLIGGAYVVEVYAGVSRQTKDFDLYLRPRHVDLALDALKRAGYKTEKAFPHWLAKAERGRDCIDLIFRAGNGLCEVDDSWFERAHDSKFLGLKVKLCAPEEMIWMKAYIMERERFDGADITHIFESYAEKLDWPHLVRRFGPDWRVLLSHLVLFGFIYPGERDRIPAAIMDDLVARLRSELRTAAAKRVCYGTLLSRKQYLLDIQERGFRDARLQARVHMSAKDIAHWTRAIAKEERARRKARL
ncbi:MAG: nucleotidyltransferase [Verrucomicrobia bacterium]|nr:nucleotidyltransferase [Verrucomicrobiota bacterium]